MKNILFSFVFLLALALCTSAQNCATGYCPATITVHHKASNISPLTTDITYGVITTTLFSGNNQCAITRNLGATAQATSATDATVAPSGWFWQFNRAQGFNHDGITRTPNTTWITPISESSDWLPANDPCRQLLGGTWRIPTETEWTRADGASGGSWATYTDTYNSPLKLHAAGLLLNTTGVQGSRGMAGYYWSSTQNSISNGNYLGLDSSNSSISAAAKNFGFSVRCVRDY